jgi:hypothetical protein
VDITPPEFATDADGRATAVRLDAVAYVALLVRGNVTDPALWPPGMERGAHALARVREIEAACIADHGAFDWEQLPEPLQDEYDALCIELDALRDTGERFELSDLVREPDPGQ